ncbi:glycosyltransferase [Parahaliea sp. F7430]|uniref:Glycosyltransferase n=1 Tax=Sediminihaliea albiluteola TaxID=2758564 RepID=A0A7W2TUS3_9GAMM|nr:glycosyltransferase [Sediminihaliea albiluteola]MBA6412289.1 glycosyltransferase [Sediminihaliea albiluteola]
MVSFFDMLSYLGSSPTRMGEILGSGLPVVANEGVGDVAQIIRSHKVGVIVDGPKPEQMMKALRELDDLLNDSDLPSRCRRAAEEIFSLHTGTKAYHKLYDDILSAKQR